MPPNSKGDTETVICQLSTSMNQLKEKTGFNRVMDSGSLSYFNRMLHESRKSYRIPFVSWPKHLIPKGFAGHRTPRVALDLGTNVGTFSIAYHKVFDNIYAFEASSSCVEEAKKNFTLNDVANVQLTHAALGANSGSQIALRRIYVGNNLE